MLLRQRKLAEESPSPAHRHSPVALSDISDNALYRI
jgi:hypothetical protein